MKTINIICLFFLSFFGGVVFCYTGSSYTFKNESYNERTTNGLSLSSGLGGGLVHSRKDLLSVVFRESIPSSVTTTITSTGTVSQASGLASISSGTGATSSAQLETNVSLLNLPGSEGYAYFTAMFSGGATENSTQWIGIYDDNNGFAIGYSGTTFAVLYRNASVDTVISQDDFSIDRLDGFGLSKMEIDVTKLNLFRISVGLLGGSSILFEVLKENNDWQLFHKIDVVNSRVSPILLTSSFPIRAKVTKTSSDDTDLIIKTEFWGGGAATTSNGSSDVPVVIPGINNDFGKNNQYYRQVTSLAQDSTDYPIFSIRNRSNFLGVSNKFVVQLVFSGLASQPSTGSANIATFKLVKNASLNGSSYTDYDTSNSIVEYDVSATSYTGGIDSFVIPLIGSDSKAIFFKSNKIILLLEPGDSLTISVSIGKSTDIMASLLWNELL